MRARQTISGSGGTLIAPSGGFGWPTSSEGPVGDVVARAVGEVQPQEDEHLRWAQETRSKDDAASVQEQDEGHCRAKVEELTAKVRDMFS